MSGIAQESRETGNALVLALRDSGNSDVDGMLSVGGFEVIPVEDGSKAFEQIGGRTPEIIIVAAGEEGIEVCRRLKENMTAREAPIVFIAGEAERSCVSGALDCGAADYLVRPFGAGELIARVRLNLELARARQELRRYEHRVRELRAEKTEFLSMVAHDLRSPLSNIVTSADIVASDPEMPREQTAEFLQIICSSARHMIHLVENLMDLNAIEQGRMKMDLGPCELGVLMRGVAANYDSKARAKQQELAISEDHGPLVAMADQHSAIQIFDNLVSNAIKYSPTG